MAVTIKDIAAQLGVSHATVSRALSGFPYVSEEMRQRVLEVARELNYRPNALARGLKDRRTRVVGLLIPDLLNDFYASAATIIQATLAAHDYRVLLCVTSNDPDSELEYLRAMREERVEGVIWVPRKRNAAALHDFAAEQVPVIEFARHTSGRLDHVVANDQGGATAATEHLLDLGHRRIGLIVGRPELSTGRERLDGYRQAFADRGLAIDEAYIKTGRFDRAWGREATLELLDLPTPPTAVFCTSSELVVGALHALDARGLEFPHHLSLVGFGDPEWFALWHPPITTVAFPTEDLAISVAESLLRRMRRRGHAPGDDRDRDTGRPRPVHVRLSCSLIVRNSTHSPG